MWWQEYCMHTGLTSQSSQCGEDYTYVQKSLTTSLHIVLTERPIFCLLWVEEWHVLQWNSTLHKNISNGKFNILNESLFAQFTFWRFASQATHFVWKCSNMFCRSFEVFWNNLLFSCNWIFLHGNIKTILNINSGTPASWNLTLTNFWRVRGHLL